MSDTEGISILIPVYNFDIRPLVQTLSREASQLTVSCEIRCYDDCSDNDFKSLNKEVKNIPLVIYQELSNNIGRSRIRNMLAREAKYKRLLFLDSDSSVLQQNFIRQYLAAHKNFSVVSGGTCYEENNLPQYSLRYFYGKKREEKNAEDRKKTPYSHINLNNLFLSKDIYLDNQLDESIQTYGHEDTKFADLLRKKSIPVIHINNPVIHSGLETNKVFLNKTSEAIKNFYKITQEGFGHHSRLFKYYNFLKISGLKKPALLLLKAFHKKIEKNLLSANPSLFYFDLFKLKLLLEQ